MKAKTVFRLARVPMIVTLGIVGLFGCDSDEPATEPPSSGSDQDASVDAPAETASCIGSKVSCGGECVDTATSPEHCGTCGNACAGDEVCSASACGLKCTGGTSVCSGDAGPKLCVNLDNDPVNCGGCGTVCEAGQVCSSGECSLTCAQGTTACSGKCIDTQTNNASCGSCDNACEAGTVCSNGECATNCAAGMTICDGACTDPSTSLGHCGATDDCAGANAGTQCAAGEVCSAGSCALSCQQGLIECNGVCTDPSTSLVHCGAADDCAGANAGTQCAAGEVCSAGSCALACPTGQTPCSGECVDVKRDPLHCGACDSPCPDDNVCADGSCALSCPTGTTDCDDSCTVTTTDPNHCGVCGNSCEAVAHADAVCVSGTCSFACEDFWLNCNLAQQDGCETDAATDVTNCGACGFACAFPNATPECVEGACAMAACDPDWGDCDGDPSNGCETSLLTDANCGLCGNACTDDNDICTGDEKCDLDTAMCIHTGFANDCGTAVCGASPSGCFDCGSCELDEDCASGQCAACTPSVTRIAQNLAPPRPAGMGVVCVDGPNSFTSVPCPVVQCGGLTYWAFSYFDNRVSLGVVGYDPQNQIEQQYEKSGTRYLWDIQLNPAAETVTFYGQANGTATMPWSELRLP